MSFADARQGEIQNGHKCIKPANGGNWATFKLDNSQEWSEAQRLEWQQRNQQRRQLRVKEDGERRRRSLSAIERDRQYREILAQLTLHADDRADLVRRGFTDEQIELCGFKSVAKYQQLQNQFSELLPGLTGDRQRLVVSNPGYLCPVRDIDGLIVACQVRLRILPTSESNRYRWLSGQGQTLHLYPDGSDGELPLAVFRPQGKPIGISLAEGTGAKPFLVSQRLNEIVIGAAGGQWGSSEATFKRSLDQASLELEGTKQLTIYPDAGDILNPAVMKRWRVVVELLEGWGWSVAFAWWGQVDKSHPDIDELEDFSCITDISASEFWALAKKATKEAERAEKERLDRLKEEAEEAIYQSLTTITEKPWKVVNQPLLDLESLGLEPGCAYIVLSAKGTGKTKGLVPIIPKYDGVLAWFNRVALGREECHKIILTWKDDLSVIKGKKRGFCSDSAHQFSPATLGADGLLLVDECDQVFEHNFGSTCNKDGKRPLILATLEAHLNSAIHGGGIGLFMSADVSQKEIDYIKALAPIGCPVRLIINEYKPPKGTVILDTAEKPDGMIEQLLADLEDEKPCFVIDDIKNGVRGCKSIAEYIRSVHPEWASEIVEINSDTSGDSGVIDFLKNINEASKKIRLICCSPSVVSGISIENGRFVDGVYGFANGILTVNEMSQALTRVRGANTVNVWVAAEGLAYAANHATDPREVKAWYKRNYQANAKHILGFKTEYDPITQEWDSPHFDLFCKNVAYRNLCMAKLGDRLKAKLEGEGWEVIETSSGSSDMVKGGLTEAWSKIEINYAEAVAASPVFSDDELEQIQNSGKAPTPEEKMSLEKTFMLKSFGQELIDATTFEHKESGKVLTGFAAMLLKNERGTYKKQLDNFLLLNSEIGESIARDLAEEAKQLQHHEGRFPADSRWRTRQRKAREFLGLDKFLDPEKWYEPKDYSDMVAKAKQFAPMVKDALNLSVDKISGGQIFGELMLQLGLKLDKEWAEVKPGQKPFKRRRISAESWKFTQMYVAYRESLKAEAAKDEEIVIEPVTADVSVKLQDEVLPDHPPLDLYTKPIFRGGVITDKSQVEVVESVVADASVKLQDEQHLPDHPPLDLYTNPIFRGGVIRDESQIKGLCLFDLLALASTYEAFTQAIRGVSPEVVQDAIALQNSQPKRLQLAQWYAALMEVPAAETVEMSEAIATRPNLLDYKPGQEVWAYFPQSQDGWLKGIVEWVRGNTVRVKSGWFGIFTENPDLIAPGDWVLSG
jgi:hypothetical protein